VVESFTFFLGGGKMFDLGEYHSFVQTNASQSTK